MNTQTQWYRLTRAVWVFCYLLETLLAFRFVFKFFRASAAVVFTGFVYQLSEPLIEPFQNVFAASAGDGARVEWSTLLAMLVYGLAAWILVCLLLRIERHVRNGASHRRFEPRDNT